MSKRYKKRSVPDGAFLQEQVSVPVDAENASEGIELIFAAFDPVAILTNWKARIQELREIPKPSRPRSAVESWGRLQRDILLMERSVSESERALERNDAGGAIVSMNRLVSAWHRADTRPHERALKTGTKQVKRVDGPYRDGEPPSDEIHDAWRKRAAELWAESSMLSIRRVALLIASDEGLGFGRGDEAVRKVIRGLKPRPG